MDLESVLAVILVNCAPCALSRSVDLFKDHPVIKEMASEKRKRPAEIDAGRPEKKSKPSKSTSKLIAPKEEPAFQRGGASILTPLEHKQIKIQATRDALFEQSTGQKAKNAEFEDEGSENDVDINSKEISAKPKANTKAKRKRAKGSEKDETPTLRIEGLSYKVQPSRHGIRATANIGQAARSWIYGTWTGLSDQPT